MCKVKTGEAVVRHADMQNLVTSVILRQKKLFTIPKLEQQVFEKLKGSSFGKGESYEDAVRKACRQTISYMEVSGSLYSENGKEYCLAIAFPPYSGNRSRG